MFRRFVAACALISLVLTVSGCTPSTVEETLDAEAYEGIEGLILERNTTAYMTLPESSKYTIPEGAETGENGGPGAMSTTAVDYSYYPEDKQPTEITEDMGTMIIVYVPGSKGITTSFDYVDTCDARSVFQALINNNALTSDVEMTDFELSEDGKTAVLEMSDSTAVYAAASDEEVVTAVANTFIDNFGLNEIDMIVAGEDLGPRGFSQEYDAKKQSP